MASHIKWSDEALLDWVKRRTSGETCRSIAQDYPGADRQYISAATNRVKNADKAQTHRDISAEYW